MQTILKSSLWLVPALLGILSNGFSQTKIFPVAHSSKPILASQCTLGEGAFWDQQRQCLWFIDITRGRVYQYNPQTRDSLQFSCGKKIGTLVPGFPSNRLVLGLQDGIYTCDLSGNDIKRIALPPGLVPSQRLNDGKCDPQGRFWVGSMKMEDKGPKGHLFRMEISGKTEKILDSIRISNGIAWTRDSRTMFYIDTPTRTVMAYEFDSLSGRISKPRVHISVPDSLGWPDGMTLDENDDIWIGMWGGHCVSHWSGKTGQWLGKASVDAPNVTSCAFGGPDFETLYITTAREGLSAETLARFPLSGNVFEAVVGVKGRQMPYWKAP